MYGGILCLIKKNQIAETKNLMQISELEIPTLLDCFPIFVFVESISMDFL